MPVLYNKDGQFLFIQAQSKPFEEISEGLHPQVAEPLKQIVLISLRLKQSTKAGDSSVTET